MESLRGREADVDGIWIHALEVANLVYPHVFTVDDNIIGEEVFIGSTVQKIVLRLLDDVIKVYEKKKIAITVFVEINYQACHDERLAAASSHVKQHLRRIRAFAAFIVGDEIAERINLIGSQSKIRI
jgi:hypothetical protein